jgi:hypothetical protein
VHEIERISIDRRSQNRLQDWDGGIYKSAYEHLTIIVFAGLLCCCSDQNCLSWQFVAETHCLKNYDNIILRSHVNTTPHMKFLRLANV